MKRARRIRWFCNPCGNVDYPTVDEPPACRRCGAPAIHAPDGETTIGPTPLPRWASWALDDILMEKERE